MKRLLALSTRQKLLGSTTPANAGAPVLSCAFGLGLTMESILLEVCR